MNPAEYSPLMAALELFEAAEGNLVKLERLWTELQGLIPSGISFGSDPEYEDRSRSYSHVLSALPKIDGWKPTTEPPDLDDVGQMRFDAAEAGELSGHVWVENCIQAPGRELREYRFRLNNKRRTLIRESLIELIDQVDADLRALRKVADEAEQSLRLDPEVWADLKRHFDQIEVLLGSVQKPARWGDLYRHMHFGHIGDLSDIETFDWPEVKAGLRKILYGINEPLPVGIDDLSDLVAAKPRGAITTDLAWSSLDDAGFERLIFHLISDAPGYENPEWLMQTRAADRGRDLSVMRIREDSLTGTERQRIVIQCKHWLTKSVSLGDAASAKEQMALWGDPKVDVLIIATSGRFTADAVAWIEKHNGAGSPPRIEMWPESHLERLLSARPDLIAEFGLRDQKLRRG